MEIQIYDFNGRNNLLRNLKRISIKEINNNNNILFIMAEFKAIWPSLPLNQV